jgi:hypothetical protein
MRPVNGARAYNILATACEAREINGLLTRNPVRVALGMGGTNLLCIGGRDRGAKAKAS